MKRFSAQYIITNAGPVLKRGIISTDEEGLIKNIEDTGGELTEKHSTEFYNGVIIPGFVNCHCHLELSHLKGKVPEGKGLGAFIENIRNSRVANPNEIKNDIVSADSEMFRNGISLCADICNSADTFGIKKQSRIKYINLLEVFGINPERADVRMAEARALARMAHSEELVSCMVPHSAYSVSLPLFRLIRKEASGNRVNSIHFLESESEKELINNFSGPIKESYDRAGLTPARPELVSDISSAILDEITSSGNLILVHNTFADREIIRKVSVRKDLFWCICPRSNLYIEKRLPDVDMLLQEGCVIVTGTDSLASNNSLDILEELKTLQRLIPSLSFPELVKWSTLNGARALDEEDKFGSIEKGKNPGLLLIRDLDLPSMKLTDDSFVTRLI